jgi:F-type H+-transporting ATPase subunit delta
MKVSKAARRSAKRLYRLCVSGDGTLDAARAREVARRIAATPSRRRLPVLWQFKRLVALNVARHAARVESATPMSDDLQTTVRNRLSRRYGRGLNTSFAHNPLLIGGIRVRVASDLYDGSVRGRLNELEENL